MTKKYTPNYKELREILILEVGEEVMSKITDENIKDFGDFLITCGEMAGFGKLNKSSINLMKKITNHD